ncbi:Vegetative incompatibility protein [Lachnellula occidentalis]|uniref:Vegetative incompatibility protein n=1 Tax=Lachnellula occidentalis TaxID=215460 RepID=A0A8H8RII0_9HELO|nr:Vegetative incompatibility protein [Lachnellula occidentalis]
MSRFVRNVFRTGKDKAVEAPRTAPQIATATESIAPKVVNSIVLPEEKPDLYSTEGSDGIKVVAEPTDANLDIVFVHGLTGNRDTTWTHKNGVFWPQLVAEDIKTARIMTFGYDADPVKLWGVVGGNNIRNHGKNLAFAVSDRRRDCRQRPLLFIAHSLGGLVCEQALLYCREGEQNLGKVFQSTRGIIFMGTPHAGSDLADWGYRLAKLLNVVRGTNSALLDPLRQKSDVLRVVQQQFQQLLLQPGVGLKVYCFFEEKDVVGVGRIVPEHSAALDQYPNQSIAANHMDMTKFSGKLDSGYNKVLGRLYDNIEWISSAIPNETVEASQVRRAPEYEIGANQQVSNTGDGIGMIGIVQGGFHMHASNQKDPEKKCHQLFRTSEYEQYKGRNPEPVPGTCKWFLQHSYYTTWKNHPTSSLLWISADPGYGKSVLSKFLVDKELQTTQSQTTCYFFFKDDNEKQKTATNALCAILHQLFSQKSELLKYAIEFHDQNGAELVENLDLLWNLLITASADPHAGKVVCILDALDECRKSDLKDLLQKMCPFYDQRPGSSEGFSLKFLLTSRPLEYIEDQFSDLTQGMPTIRLAGEEDTDQIRDEIDLVIKYELEKIQQKRHLSLDSMRKLMEELTKVEHRTYLWLKLVFELLNSSSYYTKRQGRDKIFHTIPPTVNAAYTAILNQSTVKEQAWKLLQIVCAAVRPLSVDEISIAMSIQESDKAHKDIEIDLSESDTRWIRNLCGLFVSVIEGSVYLLHQTAKEFLLSHDPPLQSAPNIAFDGNWMHSISRDSSNFVLAQSCMWYLQLNDLNESVDNLIDDLDTREEETQENIKAQFPFVEYSANNWVNHLQAASIPEENNLYNIAFQLCDVSVDRSKIWLAVLHYSVYNLYDLRDCKSLHIAAKLGVETVVSKLLAAPSVNVNAAGLNGWTALHNATAFEHMSVVSLLLAAPGIDVNAADEDSETALHFAADSGQKAMISLLLAAPGIDINKRTDIWSKTALDTARSRGHEDIVDLLLADPRIEDRRIQGLSYASSED